MIFYYDYKVDDKHDVYKFCSEIFEEWREGFAFIFHCITNFQYTQYNEPECIMIKIYGPIHDIHRQLAQRSLQIKTILLILRQGFSNWRECTF